MPHKLLNRRDTLQAVPAENAPLGNWTGSAANVESTLHQLSPYIGKTKSSMAASLVSQFTKAGDLVYDPFSGSSSVALEAWLAGRHVVANDISPYAVVLTRAKLFPCRSLKKALSDIEALSAEVAELKGSIDLRTVPLWVRRFFHPETLRETICWAQILKQRRRWLLLASLLGILHHQRPGFLSFPSSHTVPYLRSKKFPRHRFPKLYEYRSVRDRLEAKVKRAFRRVPKLDFKLTRVCLSKDAGEVILAKRVAAIISSPPYMRLLDYGRDNRLRLWFLGVHDWHVLNKIVSPTESAFLNLMRRCFVRWRTTLKSGGYCVLIIGDECSRAGTGNLPQVVSRIATEEVGGYRRICEYTETIPDERRVRRGIVGSSSETILVLRKAPFGVRRQ
ncbi:MAG TPA: DNA adenine methylase [Candidatus Acidoferrales bacterium]|nr:DNA adenine methylase [Candidatus Acidoferrales bacterium]